MKVLRKVNFDMKDIINANNCVNTINHNGQATLTVTGFLTGTNEEIETETGELTTKTIGVLKTNDGMFSTISPTVISSINSILDAYEEAEVLDDISKGIQIKISSAKSSKSREFFYLEII